MTMNLKSYFSDPSLKEKKFADRENENLKVVKGRIIIEDDEDLQPEVHDGDTEDEFLKDQKQLESKKTHEKSIASPKRKAGSHMHPTDKESHQSTESPSSEGTLVKEIPKETFRRSTRSLVKKSYKPKNLDTEDFGDGDLDQDMMGLDASQLSEEPTNSITSSELSSQSSPRKRQHRVHEKSKTKELSEDDHDHTPPSTPKRGKKGKVESEEITEKSSPKSPGRRTISHPEKDVLEKYHIETVKTDDIVVPEKKSFSYFSMMNKKELGASHPGTYEIPVGQENCLYGLTFVFTGNFCEFGRDDIADFVKRYSGKVTTAPSGRTSFVVMGEDPGATKLEKAKELGLSVLTEEQFYKLVSSLPPRDSNGQIISTTSNKQSEPEKSKGKENVPQERPISKLSFEDTTMIDLSDGDDNKAVSPATETEKEMWTTKYVPTSSADIIGNQGNIEKLKQWLQDWVKRKIPPNRAVLISGPPGIGKTTAAAVVSKEMGFQILEYNASDTRSKKALHATIQDLLNNRTMSEFSAKKFFKGKAMGSSSLKKKAVIIMDEVDGMSSGDRGGMSELILLIKRTFLPIICICNDRQSPKVRSLANYCLDLRFRRPDIRQVYPRIAYICKQERLNIAQNIVDQLVAITHGDIRQILNQLEGWKITKSSMDYDSAKGLAKKDSEKGPFEIVGEFLSRGNFSRLSVNDLLELYFVDNGLIPLMIQENYLQCRPALPKMANVKEAELAALERYANAAVAIAESDVVDKRIHGANQEWALAPLHGFLSCVLPSFYVSGSLGGRVDFASWLGQNSKANKNHRQLTDLTVHMCLHISGGKNEMRLSYISYLISFLSDPLINQGTTDAIDEVIRLLDNYTILKEDYDIVMELGVGKYEGTEIQARIPSSVKSSLTRTYNKESHAIPYSLGHLKRQVNIESANSNIGGEEEADVPDESGENGKEEEEEEGDISKDKMIKSKLGNKGSSKNITRTRRSSKTKISPKKATNGRRNTENEDSYDEGDGFVVSDDDIEFEEKPLKKKKATKRNN